MPNDNNNDSDSFPLLPSHSAYTLHGLCIALVDVVRDEVSSDTSRRALLKANALATAAELLSAEVAHVFGSRMGEDHEQLEAIEDRYIAEAK